MLVVPATDESIRSSNIQKASKNRAARYLYTIKTLDGDTVRVVTEKDFFSRLDCIAIEKGHSYNLRLVDDEFCRTPNRDPKLIQAHREKVNDCMQAKRQMVIAQSDRELVVSSQRVESSCQFYLD